MRTDKWHQRRLFEYFTENYGEFEETACWFGDPAPNQWLFDICELGQRIELTCDEKGRIHEQIYELKGV